MASKNSDIPTIVTIIIRKEKSVFSKHRLDFSKKLALLFPKKQNCEAVSTVQHFLIRPTFCKTRNINIGKVHKTNITIKIFHWTQSYEHLECNGLGKIQKAIRKSKNHLYHRTKIISFQIHLERVFET